MARMITASGSTDLSGYGSRRVTIEVSGACDSETGRQAVYTVTVPYSSFSKTIQDIQRRGGKVTNVSLATPEQDKTSKTSKRQSRQKSRKQTRNQQPKKQEDKKPASKGRFQLIKTFKFS